MSHNPGTRPTNLKLLADIFEANSADTQVDKKSLILSALQSPLNSFFEYHATISKENKVAGEEKELTGMFYHYPVVGHPFILYLDDGYHLRTTRVESIGEIQDNGTFLNLPFTTKNSTYLLKILA